MTKISYLKMSPEASNTNKIQTVNGIYIPQSEINRINYYKTKKHSRSIEKKIFNLNSEDFFKSEYFISGDNTNRPVSRDMTKKAQMHTI